MRVEKVAALFVLTLMVICSGVARSQAVAPLTSKPTDRLDAAAVNGVVESAASLLEKRYLDPQRGARYAASLRVHSARGDYAGLATRAALAERLTGDLQAVAPDGHLRLYRVDLTPPPSPAAPPPAIGTVTANEGERSIAPGIRAIK